MNKKHPAFPGFSTASEILLENEALRMLRGLVKTKRKFMCPELINLSRAKTMDAAQKRGMAQPPSQREDAVVNQAEDWVEEDEEETWDTGVGWVPPHTTTR